MTTSGKDFFQVGFRAGLHHGLFQHFGRPIAVFTAAYQQISRTQGVEDLNIGSGQRHDPFRGPFQGDFAAFHVGEGKGSFRKNRDARQHQRQRKEKGYQFSCHLTPLQ